MNAKNSGNVQGTFSYGMLCWWRQCFLIWTL